MKRMLIAALLVTSSLGCTPLAYKMQPGVWDKPSEAWRCPDGRKPDPYAPDANRDECTGEVLTN